MAGGAAPVLAVVLLNFQGVEVTDSKPALIEVGASRADGTIRYWWAKEAVRQGELRLGVQSAAMDALMGRAGWLVGWCVTLGVALLAAAASTSPRVALFVAALTAVVAAVCCVAAIWPRNWQALGGSIEWALAQPLGTELEALESMAQRRALQVAQNQQVILKVALRLRLGITLFAATPLVGAVTFVITRLF